MRVTVGRCQQLIFVFENVRVKIARKSNFLIKRLFGYHFDREDIQRRYLIIQYISTSEKTVDAFTKGFVILLCASLTNFNRVTLVEIMRAIDSHV